MNNHRASKFGKMRSDFLHNRDASMARYICAVAPELLIKANEKAVADREKCGSADVAISIISALGKNHEPDELIAVSYRLSRLLKNAHFVYARCRFVEVMRGWRED